MFRSFASSFKNRPTRANDLLGHLKNGLTRAKDLLGHLKNGLTRAKDSTCLLTFNFLLKTAINLAFELTRAIVVCSEPETLNLLT